MIMFTKKRENNQTVLKILNLENIIQDDFNLVQVWFIRVNEYKNRIF